MSGQSPSEMKLNIQMLKSSKKVNFEAFLEGKLSSSFRTTLVVSYIPLRLQRGMHDITSEKPNSPLLRRI